MTSPLLALDPQQWEDLCDRCGRCCLVKLEHEDTGELHYTNVACRHLDIDACRCTDYANRARINPRCVVLSPDDLDVLDFMPDTCAYRLLHEGRHPEADTAALSVRGRVVSEEFIHEEQLPEHIVEWVGCKARSRQ